MFFLSKVLDLVKIYSNKTFNSISKLYLIVFALKRIYITHSTHPLLYLKKMHPTSEDFQVVEIKGELKHSVLSNMSEF